MTTVGYLDANPVRWKQIFLQIALSVKTEESLDSSIGL